MQNLPYELLNRVFHILANDPPLPSSHDPSGADPSDDPHLSSRRSLIALSSACKLFHSIGLDFLYHYIVLRHSVQLDRLMDVLEGHATLSRGKLVRYLSIENMGVDVSSSGLWRILQVCSRCPNLRGLGIHDPAFWWRVQDVREESQHHFVLALAPWMDHKGHHLAWDPLAPGVRHLVLETCRGFVTHLHLTLPSTFGGETDRVSSVVAGCERLRTLSYLHSVSSDLTVPYLSPFRGSVHPRTVLVDLDQWDIPRASAWLASVPSSVHTLIVYFSWSVAPQATVSIAWRTGGPAALCGLVWTLAGSLADLLTSCDFRGRIKVVWIEDPQCRRLFATGTILPTRLRDLLTTAARPFEHVKMEVIKRKDRLSGEQIAASMRW
ncbi:hypothetical protein HKX48_005316 [Thoreauomyces humboldtii]|nr:hypothetical protein HKX48_005316 [Thoreauomyces humboldtii]